MTRGLNKVLLIGNLGRDPDLRYTPSGKPIATFTLACTRNWITSNGERRDATEWFNIVAWGPSPKSASSTWSRAAVST